MMAHTKGYAENGGGAENSAGALGGGPC